jgi:hypothetical protein
VISTSSIPKQTICALIMMRLCCAGKGVAGESGYAVLSAVSRSKRSGL